MLCETLAREWPASHHRGLAQSARLMDQRESCREWQASPHHWGLAKSARLKDQRESPREWLASPHHWGLAQSADLWTRGNPLGNGRLVLIGDWHSLLDLWTRGSPLGNGRLSSWGIGKVC